MVLKRTDKSLCLIVTAEVTALTFLDGYVKFLTEHGWEVTVLARDEGRLTEWALGQDGRALHVPFVRDPSIMADLRALASTLRHLCRLRPRVVIAATPKAGLLGSVAAWICRVPVRVYQIWGLRLETATGATRAILRLTEKLAIAASTDVVANSASLRAEVVGQGLGQGRPIVVLGEGSSHGVDIARFEPSVKAPIDGDTTAFLRHTHAALTVCFIGRLHPDKGIDTLLRSLEILRGRDIPVRALLVGPHEGWTRTNLQGHPTRQAVHEVGMAADVRGYILATDVLCLPTLREGFPNVVLEAAALGVPSVVSNATGAIDSVVPDETGLVFPKSDPYALADHLETLANDPELRRALGANARRRAVEHYDQRRVWEISKQYIDAALAAENHAPHRPATKRTQ